MDMCELVPKFHSHHLGSVSIQWSNLVTPLLFLAYISTIMLLLNSASIFSYAKTDGQTFLIWMCLEIELCLLFSVQYAVQNIRIDCLHIFFECTIIIS